MSTELIDELLENLGRRGFKTAHFATGAEAVSYLVDTVRETSVGFGGSMTTKELGLYEALKANNDVYWHWAGEMPADEARAHANASEVYILSANGVSATGELVNIDGAGNRVAASIWGPKRVIYVVGANKVTPDLASAIQRARQVASPLNAKRLNCKTPCGVSDEVRCYDCSSAGRICNAILIAERPMFGMEAEVIVVDEPLGY